MMPRAVLLISNHGDIVGGGEISLLGLLEGFDRSRWAPAVVVPSEGPMASRCRALGLPTHVVPLPGLRRPGPAALRSLAALRRLLLAGGAGLLHANGSRAMFYAGLAGRLAGRAAIWHVRVADRDPFADRLLAALASAIVVNSDAVGRRFDWAPRGKVCRIHNGVDLARFLPHRPPAGLRASLNIPAEAPVAVSVGRFVAYKGYAHLLEAARLVGAAHSEVRWILVGDGELRGELEGHCRRLGLESRVCFTGWREDIPDLLALGDLFVLPSLGEHFGRVLIEAMAMAKAVVATDTGGVPEIVVPGETGLLVPPGDAKAMAEAVLTLLEDPDRAGQMGRAGRRRAQAEFSLSRHVEAVEALYSHVLGIGHGGV